ncbi:dephospho-CoA kinase [Sanguibacter hominis ATCC BAA-789]|uniref:Dephospho-CoA kinase n=1 Tax=Sanguibacter hominis ATCC BAA-789 TaxID=1312740 RepID=A0A9X5IRW3_9MICO|nr:dephospho-CoA kinase [Sanguibacter hominis]NKX93439.1 dephospho-CoA kinase [Sanguibacter hominis ATCC BAA-789]
MLRIGLTGGIAAGKSTVAAMLRERGAVVIDHDEIAREVVAPGTLGLDRVVERFGEGVLAPDGSLDRAALGHIVFNDLQARADLGALLHPEIARVSAEREAMAVAADGDALVVHDIPLLVETGQAEAHHIVVVVHAPADLRIRRLVEERGSSLPDARRRIAAQATDEERAAAADVLIDGAGSVDDLRAQVDELWARLQAELAEERG